MSSSYDVEPSLYAPFGRGLHDVPFAPTRYPPDVDLPLYGKHRCYHKGHSIWYDYCDIENWTPDVVANLVEEISYEFEGGIRGYWCVPRLTVYKNGLREIKLGDNIMSENMKHRVLNGNHFQEIYLDHHHNLRSYVTYVLLYFDDEDPHVVKFSGMMPKKEQVHRQSRWSSLTKFNLTMQINNKSNRNINIKRVSKIQVMEMHYMKVGKSQKKITYQDPLSQDIMFLHFTLSVGPEKPAGL
ncbi:hypothetical protein D1007_02203 [Hordeum vulgare]|nr:hypothetical protein D1007_02203 [Hordeum vulgare]